MFIQVVVSQVQDLQSRERAKSSRQCVQPVHAVVWREKEHVTSHKAEIHQEH